MDGNARLSEVDGPTNGQLVPKIFPRVYRLHTFALVQSISKGKDAPFNSFDITSRISTALRCGFSFAGQVSKHTTTLQTGTDCLGRDTVNLSGDWLNLRSDGVAINSFGSTDRCRRLNVRIAQCADHKTSAIQIPTIPAMKSRVRQVNKTVLLV